MYSVPKIMLEKLSSSSLVTASSHSRNVIYNNLLNKQKRYRTVNSGIKHKYSSSSSSSSSMQTCFTTLETDTIQVVGVPMFSDNYAYIIRDKETEEAAVVDPAEPLKVFSYLFISK